MCFQKRVLYSGCNHSLSWGTAGTCRDMTLCNGERWTHPLATLRVDGLCPNCVRKRARVDNSLTSFAEKLRRLREELARRGFVGDTMQTSGKPTAGGDSEYGGSTACGTEGSEGDGAAKHNTIWPAGAGKAGPYAAMQHESDSADAVPVSDTSTKRNIMFVGGVCLTSMLGSMTLQSRSEARRRSGSGVPSSLSHSAGHQLPTNQLRGLTLVQRHLDTLEEWHAEWERKAALAKMEKAKLAGGEDEAVVDEAA